MDKSKKLKKSECYQEIERLLRIICFEKVEKHEIKFFYKSI